MLLSGIRSSEFQEVLLTLLANKATAFERHESVADGADDQITPMLEKWEKIISRIWYDNCLPRLRFHNAASVYYMKFASSVSCS